MSKTDNYFRHMSLYIPENLYQWLRKKAFENHITMSKFIRDRLLPEAKLKDDVERVIKNKPKPYTDKPSPYKAKPKPYKDKK